MAFAMLPFVLLFILGFDLIYCRFIPSYYNNDSSDKEFMKSEAKELSYSMNYDKYGLYRPIITAPKPEIPPSTLSKPQDDLYTSIPELAEILTPDIFTQSDPLLYLIDKVSKLSYSRATKINYELKYFDKLVNKFPPRYLPYAKVLSKIIICRCALQSAEQQIEDIQNASESYYTELPPEAFSPEFFGIFSSNIFTDVKPPFHLITKVMNIPMDKLADLRISFKKLLRNPRFPYQYFKYAKEMWIFVMSNFPLLELQRSISELRAFLDSDSLPSSDQSLRSGCRTPSAKVPQ